MYPIHGVPFKFGKDIFNIKGVVLIFQCILIECNLLMNGTETQRLRTIIHYHAY